MSIRTSARALGVASALVLLAGGCAAESAPASDTSAAVTDAASASSPPSTSASADASTSATSPSDPAGEDDTHNTADVAFAQSMIVHHTGAIEMADLAAELAASEEVKSLAVAIRAAQAPEIEQMTAWLEEWGVTTTPTSTSGDHGGHGGDTTDSAIPGMMTAEEMAAMHSASGTDFDMLFLQSMIVHHQGAVQMADAVLAQGVNADVRALAEQIRTSQTEEILLMQEMLNR